MVGLIAFYKDGCQFNIISTYLEESIRDTRIFSQTRRKDKFLTRDFSRCNRETRGKFLGSSAIEELTVSKSPVSE
ncbi:hypothetical protein HanRHA438_Chr05g0231211 [Helianthus annuus]|nr:hypothetical protein HanRHA438_Chr05g0231211 [Helianthus annuus]